VSFNGKRYWIVGASEGLGRALARALDKEGAELVVSARGRDRLSELAASLLNAIAVPMDVTDSDAVSVAAEKVGAVDGVIYCAGQYTPLTAQNWDTKAVMAMEDVNFAGALRVLGQIVPQFVERDCGHIVLIGSLAGFRGLPGAIGYGSTNAALMHLGANL